MKSKTVNASSIFPASKDQIFDLLKDFETLSQIARPYVSFEPIDGETDLIWQEGKTFVFKTKLFGFIPFGSHKIKVLEFNKNRIYTNESNTFVPTWNHEIVLEEIDQNQTKYTDKVEIFAGWKTPFVYLWAKLFYHHRQRKWIEILNAQRDVNIDHI